MATQNSDILLSVDNLDVIYDTDNPVHAVQNATFDCVAVRCLVWLVNPVAARVHWRIASIKC